MLTRIAFALIALLLLVALPSFAGLYTEWLWFGATGYQSVFLKSLVTKGLVGVGVFVPTFLILFGNFRVAVRGPNRPYVVFPGGGDLKPIVLEQRHLRLLAIAVAGLLALFIGSIAMGQWLTVLQYLEATPFGEPDPLFGRDAGFYIFTLPLLDAVRFACLAIVVLAFIGSTAAYVVSSQVSLGPDGLSVGPRARQHLLLLGSVVFLLLAWRLQRSGALRHARHLYLYSLLYLTLFSILLILESVI